MHQGFWRKIFVISIILILVGGSSVSLGQIEKKSTIIKSLSRGNTLYVGGSGADNYTKIQDAIVNSSDGDRVFVYAGIYYENITIYRKITVQGENRDSTIIDGNEVDDVVYITRGGVCLTGFTVQNSSLFGDVGIYVSADGVDIADNRVTDNAVGILLKSGAGSIIHNNDIVDNTDKGVFVQAFGSEIVGNTISNNRIFGIVLLDENVDNTIIKNNFITNHREGIWISDMYPTSNIEITNNVIMNSTVYGITLGTSDSVVNGNLFCNNSIAVTLVSAQHNDIRDNTFRDNDRGLWVVGAVKNRIHRNNFIENGEDAFFTHLIFIPNARNQWYRNYWDTHQIPLPKSIKGQKVLFIPFSIWINFSWVHFDLIPRLHPYDFPEASKFVRQGATLSTGGKNGD